MDETSPAADSASASDSGSDGNLTDEIFSAKPKAGHGHFGGAAPLDSTMAPGRGQGRVRKANTPTPAVFGIKLGSRASGFTMPCDAYRDILAFLPHKELCAFSAVSTELEEAVRQEQNERDEASEEELHAFVRTFRLHDEIERSALPNEIKELPDEFIDPRTDQEHWGSMPVHAQLSAFEGYIWRLREKIEVMYKEN